MTQIIIIITITYLVSTIIIALLAKWIDDDQLLACATMPLVNTLIIIFFIIGTPFLAIKNYLEKNSWEKNKNKPFSHILYTRK